MPDPLDTLTVTVQSPDGNIEADVDRRFGVTLRFRRGAYHHYTESMLEHQLGQLSRLVWPAYMRKYRAALDEAGRVTNDWDPKQRAYRAAMMRIEVSAISDGGYVEVSCTGLERWMFRIRPGTLAQLAEDRLAAEIRSAVADAGAQYQDRAVLLKDEYFGYDLPPRVRETIERLAQL
jgi:hypothetical protein